MLMLSNETLQAMSLEELENLRDRLDRFSRNYERGLLAFGSVAATIGVVAVIFDLLK